MKKRNLLILSYAILIGIVTLSIEVEKNPTNVKASETEVNITNKLNEDFELKILGLSLININDEYEKPIKPEKPVKSEKNENTETLFNILLDKIKN